MDAAWLFTGPEIGLKKQKVEDLKKEIAKTYGEIESYVFYAYETNSFDVLNLLQSISLFSSPIFVEFRNAELIKSKEEINSLSNWIKTASPDNVSFLVLESAEFSIDKKLEAAFSSRQKQIFWELFENKKQDWIRRFFANHSMNISNPAIEAILSLLENNTEALKNECKLLALYFEPGTNIEERDIEKLLSHNKDEDVFSLFNVLSSDNVEKTFDILNKLLLSKNFSAVQFIIGLTYCFRRLYDIQSSLRASGESVNETILRRFGITSKKAISQNIRALNLWSEDDLKEIILLLNNADLRIRKTSSALQNTILEVTILKILKKELYTVSGESYTI